MKTFFRLITLLEGLSYILLLFIAVPIKYWGGEENYVKILGKTHGVLFMLYLVLVLLLKDDYQWNSRDILVVCIASIIPFGTFYVDKRYLR
tara:strand:+ start:360 stop:632 length:273 start_codon:yes stop_codon:yes gene_type:complete